MLTRGGWDPGPRVPSAILGAGCPAPFPGDGAPCARRVLGAESAGRLDPNVTSQRQRAVAVVNLLTRSLCRTDVELGPTGTISFAL